MRLYVTPAPCKSGWLKEKSYDVVHVEGTSLKALFVALRTVLLETPNCAPVAVRLERPVVVVPVFVLRTGTKKRVW